MLMCWLLGEQVGGRVCVSVRQLQHDLKLESVNRVVDALMLLRAEKWISSSIHSTGSIVTINDLAGYGLGGTMPVEMDDIPDPALYKGDLYVERRTVLNAYRRITEKRGDDAQKSEAAITYWLEGSIAPRRDPISVDRLVAAVDEYERSCQGNGRTYRKFAHNFFDPDNGVVEEYLPDEVEAEVKGELREETKKMREVFRRKG